MYYSQVWEAAQLDKKEGKCTPPVPTAAAPSRASSGPKNALFSTRRQMEQEAAEDDKKHEDLLKLVFQNSAARGKWDKKGDGSTPRLVPAAAPSRTNSGPQNALFPTRTQREQQAAEVDKTQKERRS